MASGEAKPEEVPELVDEYSLLAPTFGADCGRGCPAFWFVEAEAFALNRDNGGSNCQSFNLQLTIDDFEWEPAGRVTIGRQIDCLDGWELTLTSTDEWEVSDVAADAAGGLPPPVTGFGGVNVSAFNNGVLQQLSYSSQLHSLEYNWRQSGWGLVSTLAGLRYFHLDEQLTLDSLNLAGQTGNLNVETASHLFGAQVGLEMIYPMMRRWNVGARGKLGGYLSFSDSETQFTNAGVRYIDNCDDDFGVGFVGEIGLFTTVQLLPRVSLRAGYELWYLWGVAPANDQTDFMLSPGTGMHMNNEEDLFYHGATAGVEFVW